MLQFVVAPMLSIDARRFNKLVDLFRLQLVKIQERGMHYYLPGGSLGIFLSFLLLVFVLTMCIPIIINNIVGVEDVRS